VQYFEGDTMKARLKAAAYQAITKANYQGPRRNFEFSTYVTIHQRAHQDLARYNEPVPELKKVRDFLEGITDPRCESIKLQVLSNPLYTNDFMETVIFFAGAIDLLNKNHTSLTRRVSELTTARGGGRVNNHRGGRQGRSGRNQGRSYSPEEWQNLLPEERARVYRARENQQQYNPGRGGGRGTGRGRYLGGRGRGRGRQQNEYDNRSGGGAHRSIAEISTNDDGNDTEANQRNDDVSELTRTTNHIDFNNGMTRRRINAIYSSVRRIVSARSAAINPSNSYTSNVRDDLIAGQAELDSHADTCGVNDTAYILEYTNRVVEVAPFSDSWQAMEEIPIIRAALAYDDPVTGETFILMVGQALYFGDKLKHTLLNPNQMRANGVIVDDVPRHLSPASHKN